MRSTANESGEPLTPAGRLFLQPNTNQVIHCVIGVKNPIDVDSIKPLIRDSLMLQHPRFTSLMVRDHRGLEHWRRTEVDIDQHIKVIEDSISTTAGDDESAVNDYLAELCIDAAGLSTDKPLWEIHVLIAHKCVIFRIHHALGDGISLMSMLLANCRKVDDPEAPPTMVSFDRKKGRGRNWRDWKNLWGFVVTLWFCVVFSIEFVLRCLWVRDRRTVISGGAGVEEWPRKLATAKLRLEDMKSVKKAVTNATINDVLFGIISSGLSRYLDFRAPNGLQKEIRITGVAMVNLRPHHGLQDSTNLMRSNSGARWGNKFGMILLPVSCHGSNRSDPLEYVGRAKAMIDRKKQSLEAHFSYKVGDFVMSTLGAKALTLNMLSYAGRADMQIQVAKDIIPDPQFLAKCFEDALLEMKDQAMAKS
ncbi:wax ester synthase/diacylglycerol acyltransferase 11-like isoform X2 [Prosopis cineraria]|uniref:wax ester synthase/diacylglycerol acyltransferase 11-like isoform X2 n=1 Tax=Prosopis cineraria TaxID=364024 RepID=UPI00240EABC0|nr:wax ester synthase/diacylglycerol acyltransferase 11-like isoform X2 [Prosopis cineraria]